MLIVKSDHCVTRGFRSTIRLSRLCLIFLDVFTLGHRAFAVLPVDQKLNALDNDRFLANRPYVGALVNMVAVDHWRTPIQRTLLGFSDQQLLTSIIVLAIGFAQRDTMTVGDFGVLATISFFCNATHAITIWVLHQDYRAHQGLWMLRFS